MTRTNKSVNLMVMIFYVIVAARAMCIELCLSAMLLAIKNSSNNFVGKVFKRRVVLAVSISGIIYFKRISKQVYK